MTVARSVADVLDDHVVFEVGASTGRVSTSTCPNCSTPGGLLGFVQRHLGFPVASTAPLAKITDRFAREVQRFADAHRIPWVDVIR